MYFRDRVVMARRCSKEDDDERRHKMVRSGGRPPRCPEACGRRRRAGRFAVRRGPCVRGRAAGTGRCGDRHGQRRFADLADVLFLRRRAEGGTGRPVGRERNGDRCVTARLQRHGAEAGRARDRVRRRLGTELHGYRGKACGKSGRGRNRSRGCHGRCLHPCASRSHLGRDRRFRRTGVFQRGLSHRPGRI